MKLCTEVEDNLPRFLERHWLWKDYWALKDIVVRCFDDSRTSPHWTGNIIIIKTYQEKRNIWQDWFICFTICFFSKISMDFWESCLLLKTFTKKDFWAYKRHLGRDFFHLLFSFFFFKWGWISSSPISKERHLGRDGILHLDSAKMALDLLIPFPPFHRRFYIKLGSQCYFHIATQYWIFWISSHSHPSTQVLVAFKLHI